MQKGMQRCSWFYFLGYLAPAKLSGKASNEASQKAKILIVERFSSWQTLAGESPSLVNFRLKFLLLNPVSIWMLKMREKKITRKVSSTCELCVKKRKKKQILQLFIINFSRQVLLNAPFFQILVLLEMLEALEVTRPL